MVLIDRVVIIDPALRNRFGHHYAYSSALVAAAQAIGLGAVSFVNEQCDSEVIAKVEGRRLFMDPLRPSFGAVGYGYAEEWVRMNQACRAQMGRLPHDEIRENDLFVVHSASPTELFALGAWYVKLPEPRPKIVINFHLPPDYYAIGPDVAVAQSLFNSSAQPWRELGGSTAIIAATNMLLSRHLSSILGFNVLTYPIIVETSDLSAPDSGPSQRPIFFYSGSFEEKGLQHIVDIVIDPTAKLDDLDFVLHLSSPDQFTRVKEIFNRHGRKIEMLEGMLSREDYVRRFMEASAVLLPYSPAAYRMRCSAMFVEAMASGRPVVTSSGTQTSQDLINLGLPGVVARQWTATGVYRAIRRLRAELHLRTEIARSVGPNFGREFTASTVLSSMLRDLSVQ